MVALKNTLSIKERVQIIKLIWNLAPKDAIDSMPMFIEKF